MSSLTEALSRLPIDRLRALVTTRGIPVAKLGPAPNRRQLIAFVVAELNKPQSSEGALTHVNSRDLRLLQLAVTAHRRNRLSYRDLLETVGGEPFRAVVDGILERLEPLGLMFRLDDTIVIADPVMSAVPVSLSDLNDLESCLNAYDNPAIKRIFNELGLGNDPPPKPRAIELIRSFLLDNGARMEFDRPLDDEEVAVLEYIIDNGAFATPGEVAANALGGRSDEFFRYDWQNRWKQGRSRNGVDRLLERGLIYVVTRYYGYELYLVVPCDLLRAITTTANADFWTSPPVSPTLFDMSAATGKTHASLIRDAVIFMASLETVEAARTSTGNIHKTSLKNVARSLSIPDERYAGFVYALCRSADLILPEGAKGVYAMTSRGQAWLDAPPAQQLALLFQAWRYGSVWLEMLMDPLARVGVYRPIQLLMETREALLGIVQALPNDRFGEPISIGNVFLYNYPIMAANAAKVGDVLKSQAGIVRRLAGDALFWLGAAEIGEATFTKKDPSDRAIHDEPDEPYRDLLLRLTPTGRGLLSEEIPETVEEAPREDKFIVQANAEIFISPYLDPSILFQLLSLTEPAVKGSASGTFRITRESLRRALDAGMTQRSILSFLQAGARTGIPQNIEYLINEVADRHGHIHLGSAQYYLQTDTPLLMQEILARREVKPFIIRSLSETVALLKADNLDKVLRDLRKLGYLPVSDDPEHQRTRPARAKSGTIEKLLQKPGRQAEAKSAASEIDWERVSRDTTTHDGAPALPFVDPSAPPIGALRDANGIRALIKRAAQERLEVQVAIPVAGEPLRIRVVRPTHSTPTTGVGVNAETGQIVTFGFEGGWARLTGKHFQSPHT